MGALGLCAFMTMVFAMQGVCCSKILALMTVPSHSHHLWNQVYLKALTARGHQITYVGVDEYKKPPENITYILLEHAYDHIGEINFTDVSAQSPYESLWFLNDWYDACSQIAVKQKGFQVFLDVIKKEKFDLVVFDLGTTAFLLGAIDVMGRPPVIGVTAFGIPPWVYEFSGTPYPIQNNPHFILPFAKDLNFMERLENAVFFLVSWFLRERHLVGQDALSKQVFGPGVRHITDIGHDININVVNANWATENPFPATPGLIPISGLHIAKPKPLPQDLQQFLDSSPEGVIYFSLGSNIQSTHLHQREIEVLTSAFKQLAPVKVLWKWEKDVLPGKPVNVRTQKWLPQNDILAHPNVRLFFTHGGMLSSQEAVYHGVPVVGMPVFLDQHVNVQKAVKIGYGEALNLKGIQTEQVVTAIKKVLNNPSYKKTVKELSGVFRDQMNEPLDAAVYWTEYTIRHKGAAHLRPPSKNLNWFQSNLYDLLLVFLVSLLVVLCIVRSILRCVIRALFGSKQKLKKQ